MAKGFCAEQAAQIAFTALRLTGGEAYLHDSPVFRRLREALLGFFAGGTLEIGRNAIARSLGL